MRLKSPDNPFQGTWQQIESDYVVENLQRIPLETLLQADKLLSFGNIASSTDNLERSFELFKGT
jgi:hypothetical protein